MVQDYILSENDNNIEITNIAIKEYNNNVNCFISTTIGSIQNLDITNFKNIHKMQQIQISNNNTQITQLLKTPNEKYLMVLS